MTTHNATWIRCVAWSLDGTRLTSGGDDGYVYLWDATGGTQMLQLAGHPGMVVALSWIPSGEWLISGDGDGRLRWWEVPNGECVRVQEAHQCTVHSLKVSPNGRLLAICGEKGSINIWDLKVASIYARCDATGPTSACFHASRACYSS